MNAEISRENAYAFSQRLLQELPPISEDAEFVRACIKNWHKEDFPWRIIFIYAYGNIFERYLTAHTHEDIITAFRQASENSQVLGMSLLAVSLKPIWISWLEIQGETPEKNSLYPKRKEHNLSLSELFSWRLWPE
jgi:hypothetical protein